MTNEIVVWGTKIGQPDWMEDIIYCGFDSQKAIDAKQWAINNGFDRIRASNIDLNIKPNFINTAKI